MIISTKRGTPAAELDKIIREFEAKGLSVTMIRGTDYNVRPGGRHDGYRRKTGAGEPVCGKRAACVEPYKRRTACFTRRTASSTWAASRWAAAKRSPSSAGRASSSEDAGRAHCPRSEGRGRLHAARRLYKPRTSPYAFQGLGTRGAFGHGGGA